MRRIALCAVVCLSLSGALAQARTHSSTSTSSSTVHPTSAQKPKPHKKASKHHRTHPVTQLSTATAKPSLSTAGSATLFGDSAVERSLDSNVAGWAEAFPFTSPAAGKVSSIYVYVASQNKATTLLAGIYANSNGNPGSLLSSGTLSSPKAGAWNRVPVSAASLGSGKYWIGLLGRGGVLYFNDRPSGSCTSVSSSQMSATALSSTWAVGGPSWSSCPVSAYVTGSPVASVASTGGSGGGSTSTTPTTSTTTSTTSTTTSTTSTTTSTTSTTPVPTSVAPVNVLAPSVSGNAIDGQAIRTTDGTWQHSPTSFVYQWQDCVGASCTNIAGATSSTYTLTGADVGKTVRSVVTASNSAGAGTAASATTSVVAAQPVGGVAGGAGGSYTCTQHVTTSTFASAYAGAGAGAVLCLAPGSYGSFTATNKSSMVVITPDVSAGATAPTGNGTGDVNGNVMFSGADFTPASEITMDGITFTGDVSMSGNTHDITLHDSLFHQHLLIDDTSMNNADIVVNYNMFPGDKADCLGGPEGRIWPHDSSHSSTPDGVIIESNNIGGATSQCDGIQIGGYGVQVLSNWFHDFHYQNSAHTDGIQDYGGSHELVKGNFMYNVPDCFVSYDGTDHADVEDNICVNDGSQSNGGSPNDLDILGDAGSIIKHNTVVAYKDAYNNAGGCITLGAKSGSSSGTVITDNISTCLVTDSGGRTAAYSENHNMWVSSGPSGSGDLRATPTYAGGSCASLSSSQSPFCSDSWSGYLLAAGSPGSNAADDGTDLGAYGAGPVTPGGPA